ncbi:MAG: arginine--tRNA ligase [Chloroflexi bacterium RBG_19FT_COMBO_62_14]|nr:MAG: arginine--tRNA ligase [Chloroflexi bacterium RBG_19FT_COMBO_62_14]
MFDRELEEATSHIRQALAGLSLPSPEEIVWAPIPFAGQWGYGTAACFQVAAAQARANPGTQVKRRAVELAEQVVRKLEPVSGFARFAAENAYINAYFETADYAARVVDACLQSGPDFGRGEPQPDRLMVEYAQPNTHHSFHIGHARNAVLGEALARIAEFAGYETIRASYPGDIGLGVITCIWAYDKFHRGQEPEGVFARGRWLANIYTEATALVTPKDNETPEETRQRQTYDAERRELLRRWDAGEPEVRRLWERTRQWSLDELLEVLKLLGISIDVFFLESQAAELGKSIVEELVASGIAEDERANNGPVIVKIDEKLGMKKEKYRTAVILRSDGTALYMTNDLALARLKFEKYHVDRSIYVVDFRQSLHFQQVFKILELWGFPQAAKCYHLAHGFVTLPAGAMSSRKGNVIYFMDVYEEAVRRVKAIIAEKNPELSAESREEVAGQIGLGALTYAMLSVDNTKDIVFDWETALSFDGQSAPYIQNAHVRANSILKKVARLPEAVSFDYGLSEHETTLINLISRFPMLVQQAAREYKPLLMAGYAFELAKSFHGFYHAVPVLQADRDDIREARLRLTAATRQTLANCLGLLGIKAPNVM